MRFRVAKKRILKRLLLWTMKVSICIYIFLFGILPLVFRYSYQVQKKILFLNFVHWPLGLDLTKPENVRIEGARNFYLTTDEKVKIGAWQILPQSLLNQSIPKNEEVYEALLKSANRPVFLYMHGNSGNRASSHRVELYQLFQKLDFHLICFDYRSYGDSDNVDLSEMGVVNDSKFVLEWLIKTVNNSAPIFVWGHSLGTGVSSHVLALLASNGIQPTGLILESPFNNLADEITEHPFSQIFQHLPWFHWVIVQPLYDNGLRFESDKHIGKIQCPIMIIHAEDDNVVPFILGEKLFNAAKVLHKDSMQRIEFVKIDSSYGLGHKYICRYNNLPSIIRNFVNQSSEGQKYIHY
ncbi:lysophosphatidylserine lipase ABHD12 isoform X2 [Phymastichus coffea]|uniref:lysophosphatidylserine lipase ABHD12 isoform X2 n=1 Tax=Phymastichus coffea TaxID=108790 RepID=UPI00273B878E|nr:lysophosphatidylserine lipase ABHD12 isoform X2 [Phymastichus coffea]